VLVVFVMLCVHEYDVGVHAQHKHIPRNSRMEERETLPLPMDNADPHLYGGGNSRECAHRHELVAAFKPPPHTQRTNRGNCSQRPRLHTSDQKKGQATWKLPDTTQIHPTAHRQRRGVLRIRKRMIAYNTPTHTLDCCWGIQDWRWGEPQRIHFSLPLH
jgi:hypothetical protein